ncbi:MAG: RluA family pseudouridine synthase, partial [Gammaproteobacteria bacterium]|nr:RluA family pseudouridine synthase [Gammaproteobacteria bacterium]
HHGHFYPSCRGKCAPILPFMLGALRLENPPDFVSITDQAEPRVVFEDDQLLVVDKPAGMLSVPGKHVSDCVETRLAQRYPEAPDLKLVHRLDMSTSGLLLAAKNPASHKKLQAQFIRRGVDKRYVAILAGVLAAEQGEIELPLRTDFDDRPRQVVCERFGKPALTRWQVIGRNRETTRVYFYPHTGRTHQLRLHAAHLDGLGMPIVGDELYGLAGQRLMLHAERLAFDHPVSGKRLVLTSPVPF